MNAKMEHAFGADFSDVRVHEGSEAAGLGARAYAQGADLHFAPGEYSPSTAAGQELIGHELAHVIQQREGRVQGTIHAKGLEIDDTPALEQEADEQGARAARGESVGHSSASSQSTGAVQAKTSDGEFPDAVEGTAGEETLATTDEIPNGAAAGQAKRSGVPVQARLFGGVIQRNEPNKKQLWVRYHIHVTTRMTREEFHAAALRQIFGGIISGVEWSNSKDEYTPDNSPYPVRVSVELLKRHRGAASKQRGITVGEDGGVEGAAKRAKEFHAGPSSDQKSALMDEIDRRYYEAVGETEKIKKGEKGKAALWNTIRDEVLFQHEYIANLPPAVKTLIRVSTEGRELTPADYERLFAIAKKIENLPLAQVNDYASKVTGSTTDLDSFEASLDRYLAEVAEREQEGAERDTIATKLIGLEEVYKKYKNYKTILTTSSVGAIGGRYPGMGGGGLGGAYASKKVREELTADLKRHGFASISEFEEYIKKFEKAFEKEAAHVANDLLAKYRGKLYQEQQRYQDRAQVQALHGQLGGVRTEVDAQRKHQKEVDRLHQQRWMGAHQTYVPPKSQEQKDHEAKVEQHKQGANIEVGKLAATNPIFNEEHLPSDKQIDKGKLASADVDGLQALLLAHIAARSKDAGEAGKRIDGKPELIYKMDKLFPQFYARQGIRAGSVHDMIIQDKMKSDAITKLAKGIALAIVSIALAVVSFGTATPAIVAAGAAIAGAGLGVYAAYEEYQEYTQQKDLADVGFASDPSVVWLVVAVAGAALDMTAAFKAMSVLGDAARLLDGGGELADFMKVVRGFEQAGEIDAKIARAAEKAAKARKGFADASSELTKALTGKAYSFPGPLGDPDVYKAVVKMAREAIKTKVYDAEKFIEELKLARVKASYGAMTPEELAKAKAAWEEAKALEAAAGVKYQKLLGEVGDATKLDTLIAQAGDVDKLERLLKLFPPSELETVFAAVSKPGRVVMMLDHVGAESSAKMIRKWMAKGKTAAMDEFLENLSKGGSQLTETAKIGTNTVILDSQTVIALADDAKGLTLNPAKTAMVKYVKGLPPGTELRVGNVTVGEVGADAVKMKGFPIDVARDSPAYKTLLTELEKLNVGGGPGAADRAIVADAFFAATEPGAIPRLVSADKNVFNKLAKNAIPTPIDPAKLGGQRLSDLYPNGFDVDVAGQKLRVIPIEK